MSEIEYAVKSGCLLNADSLFDLKHIAKVAEQQAEPTNEQTTEKLIQKTKIFLRLNPNIDPVVNFIFTCSHIMELNQIKFINIQLNTAICNVYNYCKK